MTAYDKGVAVGQQNSGYDALIDALRQSGMDVDSDFGKGSGDAKQSSGGSGRSDKGGKSDKGGRRRRSKAEKADKAESKKAKRASRKDDGDKSRGGDDEPPYVDIDFAGADNLGSWGKKAIAIAVVIVVIVALFCYWWFHPPINVHSVNTWIFIGIFILLPLLILFLSKSHSYQEGTDKVSKNPRKAKTYKYLAIVPVAVVCVVLLGGLASLPIFPGNAARYSSVLETETYDFAEDLEEVDYSQIPVIDHDSAELLGTREMGNIAEYVSQFEVSSLYTQINYGDTPVRVSPLGYADLFKWFTNRTDGIPAYVLVDMTTQEAEIVKLGDEAIFYSQSEPLARNIDRYVQLKYPFYMFDDLSFEIDDDGHAWWICPVQTRTIGLFGGTDISRVVLVDATTGECYDYKIEDVPEWVDHAYPTDLLLEQYNWKGAYSSGWLNSWLGQSGVVQTTPGTDGTLGYNYVAQDNDVWVYTGVTSATSDSSIVGFVLINQRTAEAHYYSVAGATEDSAMESAEGQVQNLRYEATFPLLINVAGQPTYFMALKDDAGLVKQYAMIDIQRYQNVAVGDTVEETQEAYLELLETNGVDADGSDSAEVLEASGVIENMAQAVISGNTHFYLTLEDDGEVLYDFELPDLIDILYYSVGDEITFTYVEGEDTNEVQSIGTLEEYEAAMAEEEEEEAEEEEAESDGSDEEGATDEDATDEDSGDDGGGDDAAAVEEEATGTVTV